MRVLFLLFVANSYRSIAEVYVNNCKPANVMRSINGEFAKNGCRSGKSRYITLCFGRVCSLILYGVQNNNVFIIQNFHSLNGFLCIVYSTMNIGSYFIRILVK